jgi:hypothetical protein
MNVRPILLAAAVLMSVEVFTWRDAKIPDSAPAAIQSVWSQMNLLVESRGGKPGIDFTAVSAITPR